MSRSQLTGFEGAADHAVGTRPARPGPRGGQGRRPGRPRSGVGRDDLRGPLRLVEGRINEGSRFPPPAAASPAPAPPESSGSYRAFGGRLQGCPPRGVRPRRWRCGCRARTARRSRDMRRGRHEALRPDSVHGGPSTSAHRRMVCLSARRAGGERRRRINRFLGVRSPAPAGGSPALTVRPFAPGPGCSAPPRSARRTPPAGRARTATPPTASG